MNGHREIRAEKWGTCLRWMGVPHPEGSRNVGPPARHRRGREDSAVPARSGYEVGCAAHIPAIAMPSQADHGRATPAEADQNRYSGARRTVTGIRSHCVTVAKLTQLVIAPTSDCAEVQSGTVSKFKTSDVTATVVLRMLPDELFDRVEMVLSVNSDDIGGQIDRGIRGADSQLPIGVVSPAEGVSPYQQSAVVLITRFADDLADVVQRQWRGAERVGVS